MNLAWVSTFLHPLRISTNRPCHVRIPSVTSQRSIAPVATCAPASRISRRSFIYTLCAYASTVALKSHAISTTENFQTFTSDKLHITMEYPSSWFRSERRDFIAVANLKTLEAATVAHKPVALSEDTDAYTVAYEFVRDRIEKEGAEIVLTDATWKRGELRFGFRAQTLMQDGETVIRFGKGRAVSVGGTETAVCIATAPKDSWERSEGVAQRITESLREI